MRNLALLLVPALALVSAPALADSQSSNTSSNSSSNNGTVRERVVDSYCANDYCERYEVRRTYRDHGYREARRERGWRERQRDRYRDRDNGDDD